MTKRILVSGLSVNIGGIGALLTNIISYNKLVGNSKNFVFDFIVPYKSEYLNFLKKENYVYYEVPPLNNILSYIFKLVKIIKYNNYDYVWINNTSKVDIFLPLFAKHIGKSKIIQHSHGVDSEEKGLKRLIFKFCEILWGNSYEKLIDIPVACSEPSANYFYKRIDLRNNCLIMHNGIFLDKFIYNEKTRQKYREDLGAESEDIIILGAVGRLTNVKNYSFLVKLMSLLPDNYLCIIIGDGEEEDLLKNQIQNLNIKNKIKLLGRRNDISELLSAMDCYLMPSLNEGLPFSIIEAQASGLYCIASDGISPEANLFGNVIFLKLSQIDLWKKVLLNTYFFKQNIDRKNIYLRVKEAGYSIENSYNLFLSYIIK